MLQKLRLRSGGKFQRKRRGFLFPLRCASMRTGNASRSRNSGHLTPLVLVGSSKSGSIVKDTKTSRRKETQFSIQNTSVRDRFPAALLLSCRRFQLAAQEGSFCSGSTFRVARRQSTGAVNTHHRSALIAYDHVDSVRIGRDPSRGDGMRDDIEHRIAGRSDGHVGPLKRDGMASVLPDPQRSSFIAKLPNSLDVSIQNQRTPFRGKEGR